MYYVNTNSYPKFDVNILKDDREVQQTKFKQKKISNVQSGQMQYKLNLICIILCQDKFIYRISSQYHKRTGEKSLENNIFVKAITQLKIRQTWQSLNLTCIRSRQIHIWNLKSICRKMTKISPENEILAKGSKSCKSRSNATKVELDLYYAKANSYNKFQVNITKSGREKFGKLNFCKGQ